MEVKQLRWRCTAAKMEVQVQHKGLNVVVPPGTDVQRTGPRTVAPAEIEVQLLKNNHRCNIAHILTVDLSDFISLY